MDAKPSPSSDSRTSTPEPKTTFKDKREALEAFKELLREKVILLSWPLNLNERHANSVTFFRMYQVMPAGIRL